MRTSSFWDEYEQNVRDWMPKESGDSTIFFRDGIVGNAADYKNAKIKPLFILKEVHDNNGCENCKHPQCVNDINARDTAHGNQPRWIDFCRSQCGFNSDDGMWGKFKELVPIFTADNIGIEQAAVINLKKVGGGGRENADASLQTMCYSCHAIKFREYICRQIKEINPSIIIACGTYNTLVNAGIVKKLPLDYYHVGEKQWRIGQLEDLGTKTEQVIELYHPACRGSIKTMLDRQINYWRDQKNHEKK